MNSYNSLDSNATSNDNQARLISSRIDLLEKHLLDIYTSLGSYTRRIARLRDDGDVLATQIYSFSEAEKLNTSMKSCLEQFSNRLFELQDYRNAEIQRLELKVIDEISQYGDLIRKTKEEIKSNNSARNKYLNLMKEAGRSGALNEVSTAHKAFEIHAERFESRKNSDIKKILSDFITIELQYHVKGIEILTQAYKDILEIDEDADLKEFCLHFNISSSNQNLNKKKSPSHTSLDFDRSKTEENKSTLKRFYSNPNFNFKSPTYKKGSLESDDDASEEDAGDEGDEDPVLMKMKSEKQN